MNPESADRLPPETFQIDVDAVRRGYYTDEYFNNAQRILAHLAAQNYRFQGTGRTLSTFPSELQEVDTGNLEVDMQIFTRRKPFSIVCGTDYALAFFKLCTGHFDTEDHFIDCSNTLTIRSLRDGDKVVPWLPVMRVCGRYRDFANLETLILGVLTRATRIATNVYKCVEAAGGKPIFFFPARFDPYHTQALDGYAYKIGLDAYNRHYTKNVIPLVSTAAQGSWWGGMGGGTVSHSYLLCFLRDTAEAMMKFADILPPEIPRIALVDVNNDCIGDSLAVAKLMFSRYCQLLDAGQKTEAQRYLLYAVRADTPREIHDVNVPLTGHPEQDNGVCSRLVIALRQALDRAPDTMGLPNRRLDEARSYFRNIKIVVSGGFNPERIRQFEAHNVPADMYGIGSYMFDGESNDYTADVVRVKINQQWHELAKVGRQALENPDMQPVRWP